MAHYVAIRNQMTNCQDNDLMTLARDLLGTNSGIRDSGHYLVAEKDPVAMAVGVATGVAYVYSSSLGIHMRTNLDTAVTKTIDSNSSGSTRIDIICIKIDTAATADANASNIASVDVVKGTPGEGAPSTPANYYKLAEVSVADGETEITDTEITSKSSQIIQLAGTDLDIPTGGKVNLPSGGNIEEADTDPYKTIDLYPGFLKPTATDGCAASTRSETSGQKICYDTLDFDKDADEYAYAWVHMPDNWDGLKIQFRFIWEVTGGGAAETLVMELSGRAFADNDALDQAVGTAIEVEDTWHADEDEHISPWSGDVTLAGTLAGGQEIYFLIMRDITSDDLGGDAKIKCVQIRYKEKQYNHY